MSFRAHSDIVDTPDRLRQVGDPQQGVLARIGTEPDDQARSLRALVGEVRRLAALAAVEHLRQLIAREERSDGVLVGGRLGEILGTARSRSDQHTHPAHDGEGAP